jgi:hypothetical protein
MEKKTAKDMIDDKEPMVDNKKPRHNYTVRIPPDATPEEIDAFMKEFVKKWDRENKEEASEPTSKPEQEES